MLASIPPMGPSQDSERGLAQAEADASGMEHRVIVEGERLRASAEELAAQIHRLQTELGKSSASMDASVARIAREVAQTRVPALDVNTHLAAANTARLQAVRARRAAIEQAERALVSHRSALQQVAQKLEHHKQALVQAAARQREQALARERAAKEAAAREAAARAQAQAEATRRAAALPATPVIPGAQRREQPRVKMQAAVDLSSDTNFYTGFSTNLSEGGIFIATVKHPPQGAHVDLHFTLPEGEQLEVKGVVRWTREVDDKHPDIFPGVGVQFVELSPQAAAVIKRFVGQREPMFFPD